MIDAPEPAAALPPDLQGAIEAARNRVTLLDADRDRLVRLKRQLEGDIVSVSDELAQARDALAGIVAARDVAQAELSVLRDARAAAASARDDAARDRDVALRETAEARASGEADHASLRAERHALADERVALERSAADVAAREAAVRARELAILEFAAGL